MDILKGWLLTAIIGGIIFSLILWFFEKAGSSAWLYCWAVVVLFQIVLTFIAPVVIMPLFNKFFPQSEQCVAHLSQKHDQRTLEIFAQHKGITGGVEPRHIPALRAWQA